SDRPQERRSLLMFKALTARGVVRALACLLSVAAAWSRLSPSCVSVRMLSWRVSSHAGTEHGWSGAGGVTTLNRMLLALVRSSLYRYVPALLVASVISLPFGSNVIFRTDRLPQFEATGNAERTTAL